MKRGGQPSNTNALKHGIYSRHFTSGELLSLDRDVSGSLKDETDMLRVTIADAARSVLGQPESDMSFTDHISALHTISIAVARLVNVIHTRFVVFGDPDRRTKEVDALLALMVKSKSVAEMEELELSEATTSRHQMLRHHEVPKEGLDVHPPPICSENGGSGRGVDVGVRDIIPSAATSQGGVREAHRPRRGYSPRRGSPLGDMPPLAVSTPLSEATTSRHQMLRHHCAASPWDEVPKESLDIHSPPICSENGGSGRGVEDAIRDIVPSEARDIIPNAERDIVPSEARDIIPSAERDIIPPGHESPKKTSGAPPGNVNAWKHGFYARSFTPSEKMFLQAAGSDQLNDEESLLRVLILRAWRSLRSSTPAGLTYQQYLSALRGIAYAVFVVEKIQRVRRRLFGGQTELERDIHLGLELACKDLGIQDYLNTGKKK